MSIFLENLIVTNHIPDTNRGKRTGFYDEDHKLIESSIWRSKMNNTLTNSKANHLLIVCKHWNTYQNVSNNARYLNLIDQEIAEEIDHRRSHNPNLSIVILSSNSSPSRFPLTTWIVFHRIMHAMQILNDTYRYFSTLDDLINLAVLHGADFILPHHKYLFRKDVFLRNLGAYCGTSRCARKVDWALGWPNPYDVQAEFYAQYHINDIKLLPASLIEERKLMISEKAPKCDPFMFNDLTQYESFRIEAELLIKQGMMELDKAHIGQVIRI